MPNQPRKSGYTPSSQPANMNQRQAANRRGTTGQPPYRSAAPYQSAPRKNNSVQVPYASSAAAQKRRLLLKKRKRKRMIRILLLALVCLLILGLLIGGAVFAARLIRRAWKNSEETAAETILTTETAAETTTPSQPVFSYTAPNMCEGTPLRITKGETVTTLTDEIDCPFMILVDVENGTIVAEKNGDSVIYPASMTKLMTILVAYENIENIDTTFRMTNEIIDPLYLEGLSLAGFLGGEDVVIRDMLYGSALPSGAEASVGLAIAACGTEAAFVEKMNERAKSLGMTQTNFENCTGEHHPDHVSTLSDIAILMDFVMQDPFLSEVVSTYQYATKPTSMHPQGMLLTSTVFSRMEGGESLVCTVMGGKTGYTKQALQCLVTYAKRNDSDRAFICVTAGGDTKWRPIYDSIYLYQQHTYT